MFFLYLKVLKDYWKSTMWFSLGMILIGIYVTAVWPSFKDSSEQIDQILKSFPDAITAFIGDTSMTTIEGFMNIEIFEFFAPIIIAVYAITKGADSIAQEEETHTLDQLLSLPISRISILLQKSFALITGIFVVCFSLWLGLQIGGIIMNYSIPQWNILSAIFSLYIFGITMAFLSIFLSSSTGKRGLSAGISAAIILSSYLINSLGKIIDSIEQVRFISIFYYYNGNSVIVNGIKSNHILIMFCVSIIFLIVGILIFNRRDIRN